MKPEILYSVKAQRGPTLRCKGWKQESILRMLENNMENAEAPERLVIYGGIGKCARNWESYHAIVDALLNLENDETLPELPALLSGAANESDDASEPTEEPYQPFLEFAEQILPQSVSRAAITAACSMVSVSSPAKSVSFSLIPAISNPARSESASTCPSAALARSAGCR